MRARARTETGISPRRWLRLSVVFLVLGAAAAFFAPRVEPEEWWIHGLWCAVAFLCALPLLLSVFRRSFSVVLTDHRVVFLGAYCLYFVFGAALLAVGPQEEVRNALNLYRIGAGDALRVDAMNGLGFGMALLISVFARGRWLGAQTGRVAARMGRLSATAVIATFLILGAAATFYRIPFDIGLREGGIPGSVRIIGQLSLVAILLSASARGPHERMFRLLAVAQTVLLVLVGALQLMKTEALLPLAVLTAGLALRFGSRRVLPIGLSALVLAYLFLGGLVSRGRVAVLSAGSSSTLGDRLTYLRQGWASTRDEPGAREYDYWSRLCYVPTQAASIDLRDGGRGGNGLALIPWLFVPRVLAPDKPQITAMHGELHRKITGSDGSSTAPGIFVSGYYHAGWWGLWLASALCGWIVAQTSAIARAIHAHQAPLLMPLSLLGMFIAFRIDGDFITEYLGVFVFILYPLLAAMLMLSVAENRARYRSRERAVS